MSERKAPPVCFFMLKFCQGFLRSSRHEVQTRVKNLEPLFAYKATKNQQRLFEMSSVVTGGISALDRWPSEHLKFYTRRVIRVDLCAGR